MDASHFDSFARALAKSGTRRKLLGGLTAGALSLSKRHRVDARTCGAASTICREHANCCSKVCGQKDRHGRRRCACTDASHCPSPKSGDICHAATCANGTCGVAEVNTLGAACTPPLHWNGFEIVDPIGHPGYGCCGDLVCHPGSFTCGVNRPPGAVDIDVKYPWKFSCVPVELIGYEPDDDSLGFEIVTYPREGFFTQFVMNPAGATMYADAGPTSTSVGEFPTGTGLRAMISSDSCVPRNGGSDMRSDNVCPDCYLGGGQDKYCPIEYCGAGGTTGFTCPEGVYWYSNVCYVTFSTTFTGTDSFTYRAIDSFGMHGEPALGTITIFEV